MGLNDLMVEIYASGTTRIADPGNEIIRAGGLRYSTIYPGGIFGDCSFNVPRDVRMWLESMGASRLVVRNGLQVVWEGKIDNQLSVLQAEASGMDMRGMGYWGALLGRRRWNKPWCDTRIDEKVWVWNTATGSNRVPDFCTLDRNERMRFTPKNVAWANNNYVSIYYDAPTGETIKRVTFDYDLQEGGQAWALALTDAALTFPWPWSATASGTGSADTTFGTPTTRAYIAYVAQAGQTPTEEGTYYGQISNVKVYTETGSINLTEVAKDCRAKITDLNSTDIYIGSNTLALEPFISEGYEAISSILERAAKIGDSSFYQWNCYLDHSEKAISTDGKPVLVVEQQPLLTDYDYEIRLEEIEPDFSVDRYYDELWNWIVVRYTDANGKEKWITPDDDANLKNTTSITDYGQRDYVLDAGVASSTAATNAGRVFLAEHKDPKYRMSGALNVKGSIRGKGGLIVPACQIRAGKRLKIGNFLQDLSGSGLTFLIGQTDYSADEEVCQVTAGTDLVGELRLIK